MVYCLGDNSENFDKGKEEGQFEKRKLTWGYQLDTRALTAELPVVKLVKAAYILADPRLDPGNSVSASLHTGFCKVQK